MLARELETLTPHAAVQRMQLRYGFNEIDAWWHVALGDHRAEIQRRMRRMGTQVVRIFVFDKPVPDPVAHWRHFAAYVQAVLDVGARPMITFAKYYPPHHDPRNLRTFVTRCTDIVWGCLEQWGGDAVRDWYWCVWNEPNNIPVGEGLAFEQYRQIYDETAGAILTLLEPHLAGRKARIGGPAVDGFQPYWLDWIQRFVGEVDDALVGFVSWHMYGDWRPAVPSRTLGVDLNGSPEAPQRRMYENLLMAQAPEYEARARAVGRIVAGRDIFNVCGELNTIVHHDHSYVGGLNQNLFGAAYYASALIHLIRGGADLEMRWTATANDDAYGLILMNGTPTPACLAKQLFAQHVRFADSICCAPQRADMFDVETILAWDDTDRRSRLFIHTAPGSRLLRIQQWDEDLRAYKSVLRLDASTNGCVVREPFTGSIRLDGYGIAVATSAADAEID